MPQALLYGEYREDRQYSYRTRSQLAAINVSDIDDSLEWFGNYSERGETPIILIPQRSSCAPWIYV